MVQIIGAVVDAEFPSKAVPKIYDALLVEDERHDLGGPAAARRGGGAHHRARLDRRLEARPQGDQHRRADLRPRGTKDARPDHRRARRADRREGPDRRGREVADPSRRAEVRRAVADHRAPRDRHQGHRSHLPLRQGRQGRALRRRGRRQDRQHDGADPQHRHRAQRLLGVRGRGRAHPRGQRLLSRDDRVQGRSTRSRWSTAR